MGLHSVYIRRIRSDLRERIQLALGKWNWEENTFNILDSHHGDDCGLWPHERESHNLISLSNYFVGRCSFNHSGYFYSASSSPLLFRGAPDTAQILCRSFTPKRHRQLRVKNLPKVPTWRLEHSNPRPFGLMATNLPMSHHAQLLN